VAVGARLGGRGCSGCLGVRGGAENMPVKSRGSEVVSVAQSHHGFGCAKLEDKADSGGPLSAMS